MSNDPEIIDAIDTAEVRVEGGIRWDGYGLDTLLWPIYVNRGYIEQTIKVNGQVVFEEQLTDRFDALRPGLRGGRIE